MQSWLGDNLVYGDAVPIVITFNHTVGDNERAARAETADGHVHAGPGRARGAGSPTKEIHCRPKALWQPGTTFFVNVQTGGVPMGNGYYGQDDLTVSASITEQPDVDRHRRQDPQADGVGRTARS